MLKRIIITVALIIIYWIGCHIAIPGINNAALSEFPGGWWGRFFALRNMSIFALGILPYIVASILLQIGILILSIFKKIRVGEEANRRKIIQYTRYGTVFTAAFQALGTSFMLQNPISLGFRVPIVSHSGIGFQLITIFTLTAGALLVLWLAESITERGIGYGISMIIFANNIFSILKGISFVIKPNNLMIFLSLIVGLIVATRYMLLAEKKLLIRYNSEQTIHIPLRICTAGIIPIFFTVYIISLPQTFAAFVPTDFVRNIISKIHTPLIYWPLYATLIILFTYLYVALTTNSKRLVDNLRQRGGFISDVSPERETARYVDKTFDLITLQGALFLAGIAVLPALLQSKMGVRAGISGASVLIIVGVILDIIKQHRTLLLFESSRQNGWRDVYNTSDLIEAGAVKNRLAEAGIDSRLLTTSGTVDPIKGVTHFIFHKQEADETGIGNLGATIMVKSDEVEAAETLLGET